MATNSQDATGNGDRVHTEIPAPLYTSIKKVAHDYSMSVGMVYKLLSAGVLVGKKLGRKTLIDATSVKRMAEGLPPYKGGI